jgi:IMP cyclohydrolase
MYVGRLLVAAPGRVAYRVSSRSFPNRRVVARESGALAVVPTADAEATDNPYVAYDCLRPVGGRAVAGNGSHVAPVAEKLDLGYPARDALVTALHALDFERDEYDTPRIASVVGPDAATVGIVRRDALVIERVDEPTLVATYEEDRPRPFAFGFGAGDDGDGASVPDPAAAARAAYELPFEHPVCAAAATVTADGVETAGDDGPEG